MKDNQGEEKEDRKVFKLLSELRQEKLFVQEEKTNIQNLHQEIKSKTDELVKSTWITVKQRLYLLVQREFTEQNYEHIKAIVNADFVEAKTVLGFQSTVKIENLLQILRTQPEQLAKWLIMGEQITDESIQQSMILQSLVTGLYASCIFAEDINFILQLLYELAKLQLVKSENPWRILKQGACSFRNLYFIFNEVLPIAKFFLSAALEIPILRLLSYKELYLDIDPDKTVMRYRQDPSLHSEFRDIQEYRKEVVTQLAEFTSCFISSLRENVYSFPKPIAWIVYQISKIITKSFGTKEANAIVTELIFSLYICPAIVDPEQYSICDSQITEIFRHNLIQIGQILQVLAFNKFEAPELKCRDIYNLLDKDLVSNFLEDVLFNLEHEDMPPVDITAPVTRNITLFSEEELNALIIFLHKIYNENIENTDVKKHSFLGNSSSIEEHVASLTLPSSLENSPKASKPSYTNGFSENNTLKRSALLSLMSKNHSSRSRDESEENSTVLIFSIEKDVIEPVGLLSEDKVLKMQVSIKDDTIFPKIDQEAASEHSNVRTEDKPTYSNFQDEGSIGNTSDNLEVISEAASNHSVASSLELENEDQNDNLSDMISANVSGRGTPNISGRDTPSSQVNENEERPLQEVRQVDIVQPQPQMNRQIRSEIDDKFCKFEIKKLLEGDETISIISETWSTDVLASDNETIDAGDSRIERQGLLIDQAISEVPVGNILDISETQSESAWSTDVMASDTERMTEVDNEDAGSVAQSDDTNSVARSDDTRSETDENIGGASSNRRLSNSSNYHVNYVNYQEYRKVEFKNDVKSNHTDNNANNLMYKSVTLTDTQQAAFSEIKTTTFSSNRVTTNRIQSFPRKDVPGPSGFNNNDERSSEMLLSNCSLNSSSSGSSSNSFENKQSHVENCERWDSKQWLNSSGSSLNATSTPSESTSELSVLSVNNMNNPNNIVTKKSATLNSRSLKPSASTGAIPKSISFDMSADKGDEDQRSKRGSFFGKLRMGFKSRRGKSFRNQEDFRIDIDDLKKVPNDSPIKINSAEVSDDILAKYRTKPFMDSSPIKRTNDKMPAKTRNSIENGLNNFDINNSFDDIKKKLRLVLSDTMSQTPKVIKENRLSVKSKIETILRLELGKARKLKEWSNIARISEALRFINLLNENTCLTLLQSMQEDYLQRSAYTQYLISSKQELLFCQSYLNGLNRQIENDQQQCIEYLSIICVRKFLLEQEERIVQFCEEFREINLSDEKCDYLNNFYETLYLVMQKSGPFQNIFKNKGDVIKIALERYIMTKVYQHALYPNGDGDRHRDHVLYQHIEKLARIISPDHKDLMIHKMFLREFPWLPAQNALKAMSAYRTPFDKVNCVVHCAKCIMDLLSFSQNAGSTTADDFTPVLVYVIIRVNPDSLLSTIQFVNSFYQAQLCGEEHYWWTQFCSAVEYIKTMDYSD